MKCLTLGLALLILAPAAFAGYPTDFDYACTWTLGANQGTAKVRLSTSGGSWKHGTLVTTYPSGAVNQKEVILSNSSEPQPGTTLWLYRQPEGRVHCGLWVLDNGNELVWKDCSNGAYQQCIAVTPEIRQSIQAGECTCSVFDFPCLKNCADRAARNGKWIGEDPFRNCRRDLVSLLKCAKIWWDLTVRSGDGMAVCESPSAELEELCWGWVNFVQSELPGGSCSESWQCAAGSFCLSGNCGDLRN